MQTKILSLGVAITLVLGLVGAGLPIANTPVALAASQYATHVVDHTPFANVFVNPPSDPRNPGSAQYVVGAPDSQNAYFAEDFDNVGSQPGYVTVGFAQGLTIVDGPGPEGFVWVKDHNPSENELFEILVSNDNTTWVSLGMVFPSDTAPHQLRAYPFDLAGRITAAKYVKILNGRIDNTPATPQDTSGVNEGPDIDAIEIVSFVMGNLPQCSDAKDNDGDGKIDYPADLGCESPTDNDEKDKPECSDGRDNDNDGKVDKADPGCHTDGNANNDNSYDSNDNDEKDNKVAQCKDKKDNDGDGLEDADDPGCHDDQDLTKKYNENDDDERNGQCSDKKDNDDDGLIDRKDPDCHTDGNANNDNSFDGSRDEDTNNRAKVAAVKVVQPTAVAVTAKTGAGAIAGVVTSLLGLTGLALSLRRSVK